MIKANVFSLRPVFPHPVVSSQFTIVEVLSRNIVACIISRNSEVEFRMQCLSYMNRIKTFTFMTKVLFVTTYQNGYIIFYGSRTHLRE